MTQRIINTTWFTWWESDSPYTWPDKSFYRSEDLEVRKNLAWVYLSPELLDTNRTISGNILCMVDLQTLWVSSWKVLITTDNWHTYLDWVAWPTLVDWISNYNKVIWVAVNEITWVQYLYLFTRNNWTTAQIHRFLTDLSSPNLDYRQYTVDWVVSPTNFVAVNYVWEVYFAVWNRVNIIDKNEVVTNYLILPAREQITWFTQYLWDFRVYSRYENTWIQYKWDWASQQPSYRQEWINQPVLSVINDWAVDYAIIWFNQYYSDLYRIDWTQKTELRVNLENSNERTLAWVMSIRESIVYISWKRWWLSTDKYGIFTYWNYFPWTNKSLVMSYCGTDDYSFTHHCHRLTESYFASNDNKVYKISNANPSATYQPTWYLEIHIYQWFNWEDKTFNKLKIWFKLNWWQIDIYARTDFTSAYSLIKSITTAEYGSVKRCYLYANWLANALWTFNELQLKYVLIAKWDKTASPILYPPTTWLDVVNE